jgi:hypothetical protein
VAYAALYLKSFVMVIKMQVAGRVAAFNSESVVTYGSKEQFIGAMQHVFTHVSKEEQEGALGSIYDKCVSVEYPTHDTELSPEEKAELDYE